MPKSTQEILDHAAALAARFEDHTASDGASDDASALRELRGAVRARAAAEGEVALAVAGARSDGHSWTAIGAMLGTSGEAARQRYRQPQRHK